MDPSLFDYCPLDSLEGWEDFAAAHPHEEKNEAAASVISHSENVDPARAHSGHSNHQRVAAQCLFNKFHWWLALPISPPKA